MPFYATHPKHLFQISVQYIKHNQWQYEHPADSGRNNEKRGANITYGTGESRPASQ